MDQHLNTCVVIKYGKNTTLSSIQNDEKMMRNLTAVRVESLELLRFPKAIGDNLPNLTAIYIESGKLKYLAKEDLKPFTNLLRLSIKNSPYLIKIKDPLLFQHNTQLTDILLKNLSLEVIDHRIFDGLNILLQVDLTFNKCIDAKFNTTGKNLKKLKQALGRKCLDERTKYCDIDQTTDACECVIRSLRFFVLNSEKDGCGNKKVEKIFAFECKFEGFPLLSQSASELKMLKEISVVQGNMEKIHSTDFSNIRNITYLDLSSNRIRKLASNIFEYIPLLEVFKIAHNQLASIGVMTFSFLNQLKHVDLTQNRDCANGNLFFKENLPNMMSTDVKSSCVNQDVLASCLYIEESFYYVGAAYACIARDMNKKFESLGDDFLINGFEGSMKFVEVLVIKDQVYNEFPRVHSIHIKAIHVVNSELRSLSRRDLEGVPNLNSLVIPGNQIEHFDFEILSDVPKLFHIDLRNNELITTRSTFIIKQTELANVQLDKEICIDDDFKEVVEDLNDTMMSCEFTIKCHLVDSEKCEVTNDYRASSQLVLKNVLIDDLNYAFSSFTTLEIHKKVFYMLPKKFSTFFSRLKSLTIVESRLRYLLSDDVRGLDNLTFLNVSHNHLIMFPENLHYTNFNLETFDISYNHLRSFQVNKVAGNIKHFHSDFKTQLINYGYSGAGYFYKQMPTLNLSSFLPDTRIEKLK